MVNKIQKLILFLLIPLAGVFLYVREQGVSLPELLTIEAAPIAHVGKIPVRVEIVDSPSERSLGLGGRNKLEGVDGMLFVFDAAEYHRIWMKDMLFPIDIIWISEDLKVVNIDVSVQPDTYPKTFSPDVPVRYVIETPARYTETFGIAVGNAVKLPRGVSSNIAK